MRIAFVSIMGGAAWAACEDLWADAARQALSAGHEVFVSVYDRSANNPQIVGLRAKGATLELRSSKRWARKFSIVARLLGSFSALKRFRPETVCVSQGGTYDIARSGNMRVLRSLLKQLHAPYVLLCHCQQAAPRGARKQRARQALSGAAVLGMLAINLRLLSEQHLGTPLTNTSIFQNPLKFKEFVCLPWPSRSLLRLAFVGRLESVKGLDLLIDALAAATWRERTWHLTICGSGPDREALEQRVNAAGLTRHIEFVGFVTDIAGLWTQHHALVMTSRLEGIPLAISEAMLCGRAVVATDIGGIRAAIEDGRSGFLIERPELTSVMAALERLWEHREDLEAMGRYAYETTLAARDENPGGTLLRWITQSASQTLEQPR